MSDPPSERPISPANEGVIFSHPADTDGPAGRAEPRKLVDHLAAVGARAVWALTAKTGSPPAARPLPDEERARSLAIIGWLHDIGKSNPYFQRKLDVSEAIAADQEPPVEELTFHARFGGFLTYYCLATVGASPRDRVAGYLAVAKHHGRLPDAADYVTKTAGDDDRARQMLVGDRQKERPHNQLLKEGSCWALTALLDDGEPEQFGAAAAFIDDIVSYLTDGAGSFGAFADQMQRGVLQDALRGQATREGMIEPTAAALPEGLYDRVLAFWSSVTLADKTDVMGISGRLTAEHLSRDTVRRQTDALGGTASPDSLEAQLNELRDRARTEVLECGLPRFQAADADVAALTLPTGLGKTLTGLEAALALREAKATADADARVIYALPYTSIIEQTRTLFERSPDGPEVGFGLSPFSRRYTIHHHLSETVTTVDEEEPPTPAGRPAVAVAEAWRSGLTLTTFAQLFESLTGPSNGQSMKLPALSNSVIVLDEPQTIPYRWWRGVARLLRLLVEEFDATVILMTATQPRILDLSADLESVALVGDPDSYLADAQRVTYEIDDSVVGFADGGSAPLGYSAAATELCDRALSADDGSVLAVCNTVASARELRASVLDRGSAVCTIGDLGAQLAGLRADMDSSELPPDKLANRLESRVREAAAGSDRLVVGHLTSRHRPIDRQILLDVAERLATAQLPFVLVTTQLIEAGVDVSFRTVYRDLAPLESIVQAAGRCNRSFEWGASGGTVVVWRLATSSRRAGGEGPVPSELVYGGGDTASLLNLAAETLVAQGDSAHRVAETALGVTATDEYFRRIHEHHYSDAAIHEAIAHAAGNQLADTRFVSEDAPTQDLIVPPTAAVRDRLLGAVDEGIEAVLNLVEEYTAYRVSVPVSGDREATLHRSSAQLAEDLDTRVLTNPDLYSVSTGVDI